MSGSGGVRRGRQRRGGTRGGRADRGRLRGARSGGRRPLSTRCRAPAICPRRRAISPITVHRGDADEVAKAMAEAVHIVDVEVMNNRIIVTAGSSRVPASRATTPRAHDGPRADRAGPCTASAASLPSSSSSCRSSASASTHPTSGGGFRHEELPLSRMDPAAVRRAQAWAGRCAGWPIVPRNSSWARKVATSRRRRSSARADGRLLALDVKMVATSAPICRNGPAPRWSHARTAQGGVYDIPAIAVDIRGALSNTVPVDA